MRPPETALRWVEQAAGPGSRVVSVRRLTGGITSATHALVIERPSGARTRVVLRRWVGSGRDEGPSAVGREWAALEGLARTGLPVPRAWAQDPEGSSAGDPALVMTYLPGRIELTPHDRAAWLHAMAEMLVRIHASDVPAPAYESWLRVGGLEVPRWSQRPELWRDAIEIAKTESPGYEPCLVHHDFQQFNLLWAAGRISGVVDWIHASTGPREADVAHCRLNLTLLYAPEVAEQFRLAYEALSGRTLDPWWDVAGLLLYLPGWDFLQEQAGSRMVVDAAGMHERIEATLESALRRF